MARDPTVVGRARVAAETFAEILNGFVDVISWKSMVSESDRMQSSAAADNTIRQQIFCLAVLLILVQAANSTFSFFRSQSKQRREKREQERASTHSTAGHLPPPPPFAYPHVAYGHDTGIRWTKEPSPPATPARKRLFKRRSSAALDDEYEVREASSWAMQ